MNLYALNAVVVNGHATLLSTANGSVDIDGTAHAVIPIKASGSGSIDIDKTKAYAKLILHAQRAAGSIDIDKSAVNAKIAIKASGSNSIDIDGAGHPSLKIHSATMHGSIDIDKSTVRATGKYHPRAAGSIDIDGTASARFVVVHFVTSAGLIELFSAVSAKRAGTVFAKTLTAPILLGGTAKAKLLMRTRSSASIDIDGKAGSKGYNYVRVTSHGLVVILARSVVSVWHQQNASSNGEIEVNASFGGGVVVIPGTYTPAPDQRLFYVAEEPRIFYVSSDEREF